MALTVPYLFLDHHSSGLASVRTQLFLTMAHTHSYPTSRDFEHGEEWGSECQDGEKQDQ